MHLKFGLCKPVLAVKPVTCDVGPGRMLDRHFLINLCDCDRVDSLSEGENWKWLRQLQELSSSIALYLPGQRGVASFASLAARPLAHQVGH